MLIHIVDFNVSSLLLKLSMDVLSVVRVTTFCIIRVEWNMILLITWACKKNSGTLNHIKMSMVNT